MTRISIVGSGSIAAVLARALSAGAWEASAFAAMANESEPPPISRKGSSAKSQQRRSAKRRARRRAKRLGHY